MKREPDQLETIDDEGRINVIYRRGSRENWLLGLVAGLIIAGVSAAWGVTQRLAALEQSVVDLRGEVTDLKLEIARLRYQRGANDHPP